MKDLGMQGLSFLHSIFYTCSYHTTAPYGLNIDLRVLVGSTSSERLVGKSFPKITATQLYGVESLHQKAQAN